MVLGPPFMTMCMSFTSRKNPWPKRLDRFLGPVLIWFLKLSLVFRRGPPRGEKQKILIIKISALGDLVCLLPAMISLRADFESAEISFLGAPSQKEFLDLVGITNRFIPFNKTTIRTLLAEHFDLVIDFEQWMRASACLSLLPRAGVRLGFRSVGQSRHWGFDSTINLDFEKSMTENFWNLYQKTLGLLKRQPALNFSAACFKAKELMNQKSKMPAGVTPPYGVFHPGCGEHGAPRQWPMERWQALFQKSKVPIYVTGYGSYETDLAQPLIDAGCLNGIGKFKLSELLGLLKSAEFVVCGNTGVMHLASAVSKNLVALHGPTNLRLWGPVWNGKGVKSELVCSPCLRFGHDYGCQDPVCLKSIRTEVVIKELNAQAASPVF